MTTRTTDEAKANYIAVMGEPLGSLFHSLWQEVAWLFRKWDNYVELFGSKPSRVDLLNEAAPGFFSIVQDTLWEGILLHIARLTDPPNSAGKANLTTQRLHGLVGDAAVAGGIKALTDKAITAATFCRDWRNRRIAHSDLSLAVDPHPTPLEPASREKVKIALNALVDVLNAVSQHYMDTSNVFDLPGYHGDAGSLLYVLDDGVRAEAERRDRLKRSEVRDDDFRRRDL
jgi:hypothetical protein